MRFSGRSACVIVAVTGALMLAGCYSTVQRVGESPTSVATTPSASVAARADRSFEATIAGIGDAGALFASQPSLRSMLASDLVALWAKRSTDPLGEHLVLVVDVLGGQSSGTGASLYADVREQWWSRDGGEPVRGTGSHQPIRIRLSGTPGALTFADFDAPQDGNLFAPDVRRIFPEPYATQALEAQGRSSYGLDMLNRRLATAWATLR